MIFSKEEELEKRQMSWQKLFKKRIYLRNYKNFKKEKENFYEQEEAKNEAIWKLMHEYPEKIIFKSVKDDQVQKIEGNCIYFPIKRNAQFDDEFINTFPYVKTLKEEGSFEEKTNIYNGIFAFIRQCKHQNKMNEGWNLCLRRFLPSIDVVKKIQIFTKVMKYGQKEIDKYHKIYNHQCLLNIFSDAILKMSQYYINERKINKMLKLSIEMSEQMNQINMPKTNKTLYCSICYLYDCGKHKLQLASQQKNYCYVHPKNIISPQEHIYKAIKLCKFKRSLEITNQNELPCPKQCFKTLQSSSIQTIRSIKTTLLSPSTIGLIQMGIQIFSYDPCKICILFPHEAKYGRNIITCSLIYLYFLQEYSIPSKLQNKLFKSEVQLLLKQSISERTEKAALKRKKKTKEMNSMVNSTCFHYYQNQQPFDLNCENCSCNERGFCLPQCICSKNCPLLMKGCSCKNKDSCRNSKCICFKSKRQCIPELCHNCFSKESVKERNSCKNNQLLLNLSKKIIIGISTIYGAGLGAFAGQFIKKGDLVQSYAGELIEPQLQNIRQLIKKDESFYNFAFSDKSIDARYFGNKCRFINHGNEIQEKANLFCLNMFSQGQQYIGLYARKDIEEGSQLFFDYDVEGNLGKTHLQKYPFLKKEKC